MGCNFYMFSYLDKHLKLSQWMQKVSQSSAPQKRNFLSYLTAMAGFMQVHMERMHSRLCQLLDAMTFNANRQSQLHLVEQVYKPNMSKCTDLRPGSGWPGSKRAARPEATKVPSHPYCIPLQWLPPVQVGTTLHRLAYMTLVCCKLRGTKCFVHSGANVKSIFPVRYTHIMKTHVFSRH